MTALIVCLSFLLLILLLMVQVSYNSLSQLRQQVRVSWGEMDHTLKRRYDLLPELSQAVQSAGLSQTVPITAVMAAKNQAAIAFSPAQLAKAESELSTAIESVFTAIAGTAATPTNAQSDNAGANRQLQEVERQITASQQSIELSRQHYNDRVTAYNAALQSFPASLTAPLLGFTPQPPFDFTLPSH